MRRLPEQAAYDLFETLGDLAWRRQGRGVTRLEGNLRRVLGPNCPPKELRATSREAMRSYARYWCDVFRLPDWDEPRIVDRVEVDGAEHLEAGSGDGQGFIAALPHMGNWDHVGAWASHTGIPVTTVAERLRPESVYDRFVAVRQRLGIEVLPLAGSGAELLSELAARLRAGRSVCLLADRDLRATGVPVTFFGATARFPAGPALLAQLTGRPLLPVSTSYGLGAFPGEHRLHVRVDPPIAIPASGNTRERVAATTQQVALAFERHIAAAPQDWHMLQRLWDEDASDAPDSRLPDAGGPA